MISAKELNKIYQDNKPQKQNAWDALENMLIESAKDKHMTTLDFSETHELHFQEGKKEVKRKLKELGYEVSCYNLNEIDYQGLCRYRIRWGNI